MTGALILCRAGLRCHARSLAYRSDTCRNTNRSKIKSVLIDPTGRPPTTWLMPPTLKNKDEIRAIANLAYESLKYGASPEALMAMEGVFSAQNNARGARLMRIVRLWLPHAPQVQDAFSLGQIESKIWLIEELRKLEWPSPASVAVLGGWVGALPYICNWMWPESKLIFRSIDIDNNANQRALELNWDEIQSGQIAIATADMHDLTYQPMELSPWAQDTVIRERPDLIINSSCEHIDHFDKWFEKIPDGMKVILQSNDFTDCAQHINCHDSIESFSQATPFREVFFSGELKVTGYTRFMRIGIK